MFNIAIIGQLIASRFPTILSGYLVADWDGVSPYDFIKSDSDIATDGGVESVSGVGPFGWAAGVNCINLTTISAYLQNLNTLILTGCTSLTDISCASNNLTTLDLSTDTALTTIDCYDNCLTSLILGTNQIIHLDASENQFTTTAVDNILIALDNNGLSNGAVNLSGTSKCGGTSASPSPASAAAVSSLLSKSWTVTTN